MNFVKRLPEHIQINVWRKYFSYVLGEMTNVHNWMRLGSKRAWGEGLVFGRSMPCHICVIRGIMEDQGIDPEDIDPYIVSEITDLEDHEIQNIISTITDE